MPKKRPSGDDDFTLTMKAFELSRKRYKNALRELAQGAVPDSENVTRIAKKVMKDYDSALRRLAK